MINWANATLSIDFIEDSFDFIIIDTVRVLPSGILDFLACYPNISEKTVVVFHDKTLNHREGICPNRNHATNLLFDVIDAIEIEFDFCDRITIHAFSVE